MCLTMPSGSPAPLVVVSNRGPVTFDHDDDGEIVSRRGAGGLVSSLGPAVAESGATWIACAISDADREVADRGVHDSHGYQLQTVAIDPERYRQYYDVIANSTLWFANHRLFDLARRPRIDRRWREAWESYRAVNRALAEAVIDAAPEGAVVLVHDYHLTLLGTHLTQARPDLRAVHFTHTPFADPDSLRVLPDDVAAELLEGMASHASCGFHSPRWANAFIACCDEVLDRKPDTFVSPAAIDADDLEAVAASDECGEELARLDAQLAGRQVIARVDRIELSKNIVRGFLAFEDLLVTYPAWREQVTFVASIYPSRQSLADYQAYRSEVEAVVERINTRWGTESWTPIVLDTVDHFPRSVAVLRRADVLLVNPIRDGLNLVAKEGVLVSDRDAVLVLSREAGVWDELGADAIGVNPFDVAGTADALHTALCMEPAERAHRAEGLRAAARARTPQSWLDDQVRAAGRAR